MCTLFLISSCDVAEEIYVNSFTGFRKNIEFKFKNYTQNTYDNINVAVGKVSEHQILVEYSQEINTILPKENNDFTEVSSGKSLNWSLEYSKFLKEHGDLGCFIITIDNNKKLFIQFIYEEDGVFTGTNTIEEYEIFLTETDITCTHQTEVLNGIPAEDYEIIIQ